jgi:hypothetical protein
MTPFYFLGLEGGCLGLRDGLSQNNVTIDLLHHSFVFDNRNSLRMEGDKQCLR